ncbi:GspH/FimT family pseudopilin [Inhella proteolytica]|nr:GspH/FimT family pseudopilin [Inhella proteolytica]
MQSEKGLTLIEALVGLVIVAMMFTLGGPAFSAWMANARIRGTAETVLAGLQLARTEATSRNAQVRFQLTSSLDDTCVLAVTGPNWVVDVVTADAADSVVSQCDAAASDTVAPHVLQKHAAQETQGGSVVTSTADSVIFNGMGRLVGGPAAATTVTITGSNPANCKSLGGELNCLQVQVSAAGQIRMCNPVFATGSVQAC